MCVCVYTHICVCVCIFIHKNVIYMPPWWHFWSWRLCTVPWFSLIISISGTTSLQASKQLLWSVIALELTVRRPCLGGTGRQLSQWKVCDCFATKNCPKPEGFHSRRNAIAPSVLKTWLCLRFCKTDSGSSLWQESLSHARIDSNPLISLRKTYSLHILLITQQGRPCSACSRIQLIMLPSVFLLWEQNRATLLDLLVVKASSGLSIRCS